MRDKWKIVNVEEAGFHGKGVSLQGHGLAYVAMNSGNKDKADKVLRLIAAAPDLLNALYAYRECVERMGDNTYDEVLKGIDALITKATKGE